MQAGIWSIPFGIDPFNSDLAGMPLSLLWLFSVVYSVFVIMLQFFQPFLHDLTFRNIVLSALCCFHFFLLIIVVIYLHHYLYIRYTVKESASLHHSLNSTTVSCSSTYKFKKST